MASTLAQSRCFQHASREAAARCPQCERFYCRECVTEHDGRMVCRSCLDTLANAENEVSSGWFQGLIGWLLAGGGFFFVVYCFYFIGRILLKIPSNFHKGAFFD